MVHFPRDAILYLALLSLFPPVAHAADPSAGEAVFKAQCGVCHSIVPGKNLVGPSLFGVVGRVSGHVEGFRYSAANKAANITWTEPVLDKYLTSPARVIPGTIMPYGGLTDDTKRADLIAYLATLH